MERIVRRRSVPRQIAKAEAREKVGKHVDRAALDLMRVLKFDEEEAFWGVAHIALSKAFGLSGKPPTLREILGYIAAFSEGVAPEEPGRRHSTFVDEV